MKQFTNSNWYPFQSLPVLLWCFFFFFPVVVVPLFLFNSQQFSYVHSVAVIQVYGWKVFNLGSQLFGSSHIQNIFLNYRPVFSTLKLISSTSSKCICSFLLCKHPGWRMHLNKKVTSLHYVSCYLPLILSFWRVSEVYPVLVSVCFQILPHVFMQLS